ncbi:unnamed protein product [Ectocarpus sp. CCAP 1310/34]|nr:unnamed protein product [Ectocarpus sp. CCAP 1310/34]
MPGAPSDTTAPAAAPAADEAKTRMPTVAADGGRSAPPSGTTVPAATGRAEGTMVPTTGDGGHFDILVRGGRATQKYDQTKTQLSAGSNMGAAGAGSAAPASKPGKCERMLWLGKVRHVVRHEWRLHTGSGEVLLLTTTLADKKNPNRSSNKRQTALVDWRQQSTETFLASMDSIGYGNALKHLEEIGSTFAKDTRAIATWNQGGKPHVANDPHRCGLSWGRRRRGSIVVGSTSGKGAGGSRARLQLRGGACHEFADLHPTEAIKRGVHWFCPRAKESNAASEELLVLMRQYWHTDEVSRQYGNSAERDMWKASKSPAAHHHPRRQLTEPGGGDAVYAKFLNWASYKSFKERQSDDFTDPGRTLFLSTRYKWRPQWRETWKHLGTFSDAIACPKVNLRAADPGGDGWMGRKPECNALDCAKCGFGGAKAFPSAAS